MTNAHLARRTVAVAVTLLLLLTSAPAIQVARAQGADQNDRGRSIVARGSSRCHPGLEQVGGF